MAWKVTICLGPDVDLITRGCDTFEQGTEWLRQNHPRMLEQRWNSLEGENFRQYGTNYYWAMFERLVP